MRSRTVSGTQDTVRGLRCVRRSSILARRSFCCAEIRRSGCDESAARALHLSDAVEEVGADWFLFVCVRARGGRVCSGSWSHTRRK